ncbi:MAG TPA: sigma 54-interacting transcriptional regulator [Terriglobales bacterium]|nr:sigma 54-interacting transcriptional regulator [Terriglobales bacterium]
MASACELATSGDLLLPGGVTAVVRSDAARRLMAMVARVAPSPAAVLIEGETGCGKELIARAIHHFSLRTHKPWIDVNCGALPEHLLESELFGYEKGAFSGADASKPGMFELANGGTLFLDEIGELDAKIQAKLLRVLDGAPYYRLGGTRKISVDVRIIAATNRDLTSAVKQGSFRKDLFYRLGQIQLRVPPLRERPEDVAGIAELALQEYRPGARFSQAALDALCAYSWPGNVRELKNAVMTIATLGDFEGDVDVEDLPLSISGSEAPRLAMPADAASHEVPVGDLDSMERVMIERALQTCGGDQGRAADHLGISRRTLSRKLKLYRLEESFRNTVGSLGNQQHRYFRANLENVVELRSGSGYEIKAQGMNVSATGIGVRDVAEPLRFTGIIDVIFSLQDGQSNIEAKGKMTWADAQGHAGIRFVSMAADAERRLNQWLQSRRQQEGWARFE